MKFKRQSNQQLDVNITPLIDVVFLLLIFFMVSTTFTRETQLSLDLPEATGEESETRPEQIEILIDATGQYVINQRSVVSSNIDTVMKALTEVSGGNQQLPLVITADAKTPHQAVVTAMDAAGRLGFSRLSLTTQKPSGD